MGTVVSLFNNSKVCLETEDTEKRCRAQGLLREAAALLCDLNEPDQQLCWLLEEMAELIQNRQNKSVDPLTLSALKL